MSYELIEVGPIAGAIGAEIGGIDLATDLTDAAVAEIRRALLAYLVVFFRDQDLTPAGQVAFAERFGRPAEYPFVEGLADFPVITPVVKLAHETANFGGIWHSDTVYLAEPPMATMLYARELPAYGGDTLFANQYLAYEALSAGMRALLDPLIAINTAHKAEVARTRADRLRDAPKDASAVQTTSEHPAVRTHPETGRRALYVNVAHTLRFKDMTERESAPILDYLFAHQVRPEFTCRFGWRPGSLAFWDNRAAQHNPINDYHGQRRELHRITLAGDKPV